MDSIKRWFLEEDEVEEGEVETKKAAVLNHYNVNDYETAKDIGEDFKKGYIILCNIDDKHLQRILDFFEGICTILKYTHVELTEQLHLYLPDSIDYKYTE